MPKPKFKKSRNETEVTEPFELSSSAIVTLIVGIVNLAAIGGYLAVKVGAAPDTGWLIVLPLLACITSAPLGMLFGLIASLQCYRYYKKTKNVLAAKIGILTTAILFLSLGMLSIMSGSLASL
jgi:hypothetical protein